MTHWLRKKGQRRPWRLATLGALLALIVTGCGLQPMTHIPNSEDEHAAQLEAARRSSVEWNLRTAEPAFTRDALKAGWIGVGGFVAPPETLPVAEQQRAAWALGQSLRDNHRDVIVLSTPLVQLRAGNEALARAEAELQANQVVQPETLRALQDQQGKPRYLLFVYVTTHAVQRTQREDTEEIQGRRRTYEKTVLVSETSRTIGITATIYDASSGNAVWEGNLRNRRTRTNSTSDGLDGLSGGYGLFSALADVAKASRTVKDIAEGVDVELSQPSEYPRYPKAPSTEDVLTVMLDVLAAKLP